MASKKKTKKNFPRRRFVTLCILGFLVLSGAVLFARETFNVRQLSSDFLKQSIAISREYQELAEKYVFPIMEDPEMTENQKDVCKEVEVLYWKLRANLSLTERVTAIHKMQITLKELLLVSPPETPLFERREMQTLRKALHDAPTLRSDIRVFRSAKRPR